MRFQDSAVFASLLVSCFALTTPSRHVLHEKRTNGLKNWVRRDAVPADARLPFRIGMIQPNVINGRGAALLDDISDPTSTRYGEWFSAEEVIEFFAPPQNAVDDIQHWLASAGIAPHRISQSANKQWIAFDAAVGEAEELFRTRYHQYEHIPTGKLDIACDEYHLPGHIQHHIDYITPGIKLLNAGKVSTSGELDKRSGNTKRGFRTSSSEPFAPPLLGAAVDEILAQLGLSPDSAGATAADLSTCDSMVTPPCIAAMYNITQATKAAKGNELGIFEEGDYYVANDLSSFFQKYATNIPSNTRPVLDSVDGGNAPGLYAGGESDLDFEISYPIIYPQNSILYQTDDQFYASGLQSSSGFLNTFLDAIDGSYCTYSAYGETGNSDVDPKYPDPNPLGYQGKLQCGVYKPTNVISISYGEQEDDLPTNYQQRQCSEFMKLGLQGVTVVIASGDSGVAARGSDDGNDDGCLGNGEVFNPDFPASCPYILAAGATYLPTGGSAARDEEVAVTRFPSGGGFSNIYPQPAYQAKAVNTYLTQHTPSYKTYNTSGTNNPPESVTKGGIYNIGGRGYPDISAVGDNVVIINNGAQVLIGGTSASAPVFAAVLNRINEERLAVGKKTVGFVNPVLYAHPEILHDITVGNNSGCNTPGFYAAPGWDPVTGLGTPNYPAMLNLFMSLP